MGNNWRLSPSDFAFMWEECSRCYYLKIVHRVGQPGGMPGIFSKIDSMMKRYFANRRTEDFAPELPGGSVVLGERMVESAPIALPGRSSTCSLRGKFDAVLGFDDGSYGVVDFKTTAIKPERARTYFRQLHSYAYALENPAAGKLGISPVTRLGLLCIEPLEMLSYRDGDYAYRAHPTWVECPRDDGPFLRFLGRVVDVLDQPDPPDSRPGCKWCEYRDAVRRATSG